MAVQVWVGEKPEHPNERRAIVALANGLERLEGLYLLLSNFHVGGRTVDLTIIKQDAIFIIELKSCNGKIIGGVNGPWYLESSNGERKRLNPGRGNPYNQAISYYYNLTNFLNEHRPEFLSEHKARTINFRSCRRLVVIAPTIHEDSQIDLDWKVEARGLDELPAYLVTERSPEIDLSEEEMQAIPRLLGCTRWSDINQLMAGILPGWHAEEKARALPPDPHGSGETGALPPPAAAEAAHPRIPLLPRLRQTLATTAGRLALGMSLVALVLLVLLLFRPGGISQPLPLASRPHTSLVISASGPAGGVSGGGWQDSRGCVWAEYQSIGKRWDEPTQGWISVGVDRTAVAPEVIVTLEQVDYCNEHIVFTWSIRNNSSQSVTFPLQDDNIAIRDPLGNTYPIADELSKPPVIEVASGERGDGRAIVPRPVVPNAPSLLVRLKDKPFGESSWLVSLGEH
ncbi:MAG: NERD domain-containing protein [Chloroflexaceae bacterium]|nr:NERD domain-containing protein [Chloroflexaceae bacterium]